MFISLKQQMSRYAGTLLTACCFSIFASVSFGEAITGIPDNSDQIDAATISTDIENAHKGSRFSSFNPFRKKSTDDNSALLSQQPLYDLIDTALLDKNHTVEDIAYGEILFDYFSNRNYQALVKARIAQDKNYLDKNKEHVDLMLAQLYIIEGLPLKAEEALKKIAANRVSPRTRNLALFQLARLHSYQGNLEEAERILLNDFDNLSPFHEVERRVLLANIYTRQNNQEGIRAAIDGIDSQNTRNAYTKYNLATAGILVDYLSTAIPLLEDIARSPHIDLETRSLRDKANLTLGTHYLEKEQYDKAYEHLSQVSYEGPQSNEALYYLAWIEIKRENPRAAFPFWVDLSRRNPADPFVGKSYLFRPYTLEKLGSSHQALSGYLRANELFFQLLRDVDETIEIVNSDAWLQKLAPASLGTIEIREIIAPKPGWLKTQTNELNFLISLYVTDAFAVLHQNFWELELIKQQIESDKQRFAVFQLQQDTHRAKYDDLVPTAYAYIEGRRMQSALERFKLISEELNSIMLENNFLAAPSEQQQSLLQRIQRLSHILENEDPQLYSVQRKYLAMLEGIVMWDMSRDMNKRQWNIRNQYRDLQLMHEQVLLQQQQILTGIENIDYFDKLVPEIQRVSAELERKLLQTELLSLKHQKLMREQALQALEERKSEYTTLKVRAQLAAARLQDSIVTGGK